MQWGGQEIYLVGAFLCLRLGATPEEAWGPFQSLKDTSNDPMCLPYRDATWVTSPYDLRVKECWAGAGSSDRFVRSPGLR